MEVEVDKSAWSESSKKSEEFRAADFGYEDRAYRCHKCFSSVIFTAQAQKDYYEVKKEYIWKTPSLCSPCSANLDELREMDRDYQNRWNSRDRALEGNEEFLRGWLNVLETVPTYGKRLNRSMIDCLTAKLRETNGNSER